MKQKKLKKCSECRGQMKELISKTPEGIKYTYFKCEKCKEEILDMNQLHTVAEKYREMKKFHAKVSKWGMSLGIRIPKELVQRYNFEDNKEVSIIPEDEGIRVIPG